METIPRTPDEYRSWWASNTSTPYGFCWCGCGKQTALTKTDMPSKGYVAGEPKRFISSHWARVTGTARRANLEPPNPSGLCMCGCGQKTPIAKQTKSSAGWVQGYPVKFVPQHHNNLLKPPNEAEICAQYKAGATPGELAEAHALSSTSVSYILRRNGVGSRYRQPVDDRVIIDEYNGGETIVKLAQRLGCHFGTIYRVLKRNGLEAKRKPIRLTWKEHEAGRIIRRLPAYRYWRTRILQRDNYTCTECGAYPRTGTRLHVHHILSFSQILAEYRPINVEDAHNYALLWDTDNGVTLCHSCHICAHSANVET